MTEEKTRVEYSGGVSRYKDSEACDYMLCNVDGVELYAEIIVPEHDTPENEEGRYHELCDMITHQAYKKGIDQNRLAFWYD